MKIYVAQIYIEVGITYPFSHDFQRLLSEELTKRVQPSPAFVQAYSSESNLIFRMSAKTEIAEPEIRGPTVFRGSEDVEYSIFLPHGGRQPHGPDEYRRPVKLLLDSIVTVVRSLGMDASQIVKDAPALIEHIISNPVMLKEER